jgi:ferritin-like metal-binding protein YciE
MQTRGMQFNKLDYKQNLMIKHVLLKHLSAAYYCEHHIAEFLTQIENRTQHEELHGLIESYSIAVQTKIEQLNNLFAFLKEQPNEASVSGIKSITLEALFAIIKHTNIPFEKELTILNYLQIINAIDTAHVKALNQMADAIGIPEHYRIDTLINSKVSVDSLERIAQKYITNQYPS